MKLDLSKSFDVSRANTYLKALIESKSKIELTKTKEKRSIKQNSYLHVCISIFAIHLGYNLDETKIILKRHCYFMNYEKDGHKFLKRTRDMDKKQLTDFIQWVIIYSAQNGCHIPSSEEYLLNQFEIDKEINKHKQYL